MSILNKIIAGNKILLENFFYMTILQLFVIIAPLITYPYLNSRLGIDLFGVILSSQMLVGYASVLIDFGSNKVAAKHVSVNREDKNVLSEIVCSITSIRCVLFFFVFVVYLLVVITIPEYREYWLLFLLMYGMTLNDVLFPQYYFQGVERMKMITIIGTVTKLIFILLVFITVKTADDYLWVPILYTLGFAIGGVIAMYIIFKKDGLSFIMPSKKQMIYYIKDSSAILATDLLCTIKDRFNYLLVGLYSTMSNVVIYDLCIKINGLISQPLGICGTVLFPRFAKYHSIKHIKHFMLFSFVITIVMVVVVNIFLPKISYFFLKEYVDLTPIRLFTVAPVILSISTIVSSNVFVAWGYNKYVFHSIVITTIAYILSLALFWATSQLNSIYSFVTIALMSYLTELLYRLFTVKKVFDIERKKQL